MTERIAATAPAGNNQYVTGGVVYRGVDNQPGDVAAVGFADELQATQGDGEASEPQATETPAAEPQDSEPAAAGPASTQTSITIPASIRTAKGECRVVGIAFDEGQAALGITALKVGANVEEIMTGTLGRALPSLASITVDSANKAYSSKQGVLLRGDELVYAPAAAVAVSVPAGCKRIAPGAFTDVANLRTVVVWGPLDSIAGEAGPDGAAQQPAFTDEQKASVRVAIAPSGAAVAADEGAERVAAMAALAPAGDVDCSGAWRDCQFAADNIMSAAPAGATSDAVENGLVYTMQADGTLAASWAGDKTATPASLSIPAAAEISGIAYAVSTVAEGALRDASFLQSATVAEGVTAIGESAFEGCANLKAVSLPSTLRTVDYAAFGGTALEDVALPKGVAVGGANEALTQSAQGADAASASGEAAPEAAVEQPFDYDADAVHGTLPLTDAGEATAANAPEAQVEQPTDVAAEDSLSAYAADQPEAASEDEEAPYANNLFAYATASATVPSEYTFFADDGWDGSATFVKTVFQVTLAPQTCLERITWDFRDVDKSDDCIRYSATLDALFGGETSLAATITSWRPPLTVGCAETGKVAYGLTSPQTGSSYSNAHIKLNNISSEYRTYSLTVTLNLSHLIANISNGQFTPDGRLKIGSLTYAVSEIPS